MINSNVYQALENIKNNPELLRDLDSALVNIFSGTKAEWTQDDKADLLEAMLNVMKSERVIVDESIEPRS